MNTTEIQIVKYNDDDSQISTDQIVREDPLEIFINGEKKYFCMRMPGMDYELSAGLLYSEGIINSIDDIQKHETGSNRIYLTITGDSTPGIRKIYASSGSMFSDELIAPAFRSGGEFQADDLFSLQNDFFSMQKVFEKTGGVHAVAFFSFDRKLICFAEDVGRHNALDKCMGNALVSGVSQDIFFIMLSSRISFEMMRKSYRAGAVVVAGVSAPTSAAVDAAVKTDMTLIGFLRGDRFNIYSHPERVLHRGG